MWIEFESGSKMPVPTDTVVEVKYNNGGGATATGGEFYWDLEPHLPVAIVRYRIVHQPLFKSA